jgi:hypothetical protein
MLFAPRWLCACVMGWIGPVWAASASPLTAQPSPQSVAGGEAVVECGWPDTVAVTGGGGICTGTLVHPRVVVYAAHCGGGSKQIRFGESSTTSAYTRHPERCITYPDYIGTTDQAHDWAFCVLDEPITEIPVTPPMFGCELDVLEAGLSVVIVGFGNSSEAGGSGTKRWAQTQVVSTFGNTINIGGDGVSTCQGDSGGSAFVQLDDGSWRAISIVSTGVGCGLTGVHSLMKGAIPWIEEEAQIDITPCHDLDGTWNPTPMCDDFFAGGAMGHGSWPDWCAGTPRSGPAVTCGASFDAVEDTDPPIVSVVTPEHGTETESGASIAIEVDAVDDGWGVQRVWLRINGEDQPIDDEYPPYRFESVSFPDGLWTIEGVAQDWAGHVGVSDPVTIGVGVEVPEDLPETGDETSSGTAGDGTGGPLTTAGQTADGGDDGGDGCSCTTRGAPARSDLIWVLLPLLASRRSRQTPLE